MAMFDLPSDGFFRHAEKGSSAPGPLQLAFGMVVYFRPRVLASQSLSRDFPSKMGVLWPFYEMWETQKNSVLLSYYCLSQTHFQSKI